MVQTRSLIDEHGRRTDGRTMDELRNVKIQVGIVKNADGSAYIEFGKNRIIAAVYGPREVHPKHLAQPDRCVQVQILYVTIFNRYRKNPAPKKRSKFESDERGVGATRMLEVIQGSNRCIVEVYSRGGSRACIIAPQLPWPCRHYMRDIVTACAVEGDGKIGLDINELKTRNGEDMPWVQPHLERVTLCK